MLPRKNRLKKSHDFDVTYKKGSHLKGTYGKLVVYDRTDDKPVKVGIVVSSKSGDAVTRNRTKRKIREVFSKHISVMKPGFDTIYIVWDSSFEFNEIESEIIGLMKKAKLAS